MIKNRLTSVELKFFTGTAGYTPFDHKSDENFLEELKVEPTAEKIRR
jgi:hypothetical protein